MRTAKTLLTVLIIITLSLVSRAQSLTRISGKVTDHNQVVLGSASVSLLKSKDSSLVKLTLSTSDGSWAFEQIAPGSYRVRLESVGFSPLYSPVFDLQEGSTADLGQFRLTAQAKDLKAVTVTARKPLIEQKMDRTIVNVEATATNAGANALEVLEKAPGIAVDKDGNISLKGKEGVVVYIDGRPSYLSGSDLADMLRNMNASQIENLEIMTNPPAKYDAAGNSGVINIRTKKNKQMGYNGSLSMSYIQGYYGRTNESAAFNYRKNKVNLFANLGYSYRRNFNDLDIERKFMDGVSKNVVSLYDQQSRMKDKSESYNGKIGLDYSPDKKTTLGFVVNGFTSPMTFANASTVKIADPAGLAKSTTRAVTSNDRIWKNISTNFNFRRLLDTAGTELTADLDYLHYNSANEQYLYNHYFSPDGTPILPSDSLLGKLPQDINIYTAKVDFVKPLKKGARFEAGWKSSYVETDNNAVYDSLLNNQRVRDIGRSNHFVYRENINAVYVNYNRQLGKKLSGQFGLRLENTNATGKQLTTGDNFNRHYTQLFPTAYLMYTASEKHNFGLNYGRRINRPDYEDLNPFILFLDKYTFEQGNPNLKPQFSHNIELTHSYKGFLNTTLNYTKTTDIITDVLEQRVDKNETVVRKSNIADQRQYGIAVSAGFAVTKWWNTNLYVNVFNNLYKGVLNNEYTELESNTALFNVSNQFRFAKTWGAELSGFYRTPGIEGVFRIDDILALNLGLSKQIMKGKGTLRFSARDILYSQKIHGEIRYSNIDASFYQRRDSRQFSLNFTWRFSKGKAAAVKRRTTGAGDEQSRVKAGTDQ